MLRLPQNLAALAKFAAKDVTRYAMQNVRLQECMDGYQVTATDGRRLAVATGPGRELEVPDHLQHVQNGAVDVLLPASEWARLLKSVGKKDHALALLGDDLTTFSIGSSIARVTNDRGKYPDVEYLADKQCCSILQVSVDARLLAELLLVAAEFAPANSHHSTTLHFGGKGKPLLLTTKNDDGQKFQAAMMPLS